MKKLSWVVLTVFWALAFCGSLSAQTSSNGVSQEEQEAIEDYESANPGYDVTEINLDPECTELGDQYATSTGQYEILGICGVNFIAEKAADDALQTSQALRDEPAARGHTGMSQGGSVLSTTSEPSASAVAETASPETRYEELPETGGGPIMMPGLAALLVACGIFIRRLS